MVAHPTTMFNVSCNKRKSGFAKRLTFLLFLFRRGSDIPSSWQSSLTAFTKDPYSAPTMSTDHTTIPSSQLLPLSSTLRASSSAKAIHSQTSPAPLGRNSYFGASVYASPVHSDHDDSDSDDGCSDSTQEDESLMLFGHLLERMPRTMSADHGVHYEQDLNSLLFASRSSRSSSKSNSVISSTSGASYDAM